LNWFTVAYPLLQAQGGAIVLFGSDSVRFSSRNQSDVAATSSRYLSIYPQLRARSSGGQSEDKLHQ